MPSKLILFAALVAGVWSAPVAAQDSVAQGGDHLPALETEVDRLQAHIESIESIRAIKRLQYAYGHYVEYGLWNDFADLFTEDAITNYQQGARGRAEIQKLFFEQVGQGKLGLADGRIYPHILYQPVITLGSDGRTAKGRWRILAMLGGYGGSATWYSGVYENEYVMEGGVWKISVLRSEPKVTAAYTDPGWKESGMHVPFHYTAEDVTALIPDPPIPDSASANGTPSSIASLASRISQLAPRAARENDQAEVTNLLNTYGYAFERKLWDQVTDLFVEDGTLELGMRGVYAGKPSIRHALDQFGPLGLAEDEFNDHIYLQTLVTVAEDGRTARARGVELIMSSAPGVGLSEGVFENTFIKVDGAWQIQSVHFYPRMIVDAATGWAKSAEPAPGPSEEFPPDRPPTASYEIYPSFAVPPFHFDNPVTGKPPQYPEGVLTVAEPTSTATAAPVVAAIRTAADLEARLAEVERALADAEAYDAAENLINAYGYYLDESPDDVADLFAERAQEEAEARELSSRETTFVHQILQPVIDVAPDGQSATIRARRLDLGGVSGGKGYWTAGTLEGQIALDQGEWRFQTVRSSIRWGATYPGGWAAQSP